MVHDATKGTLAALLLVASATAPLSCCVPSVPSNKRLTHDFEAIAVSANAKHTCVLRSDATPWCFGGDNTVDPPMTPTPHVALKRLETGRRFACGIRETDRAVVCWGDCSAPDRCSAPSGSFEDLSLHDDSGGCAWSTTASRVACWGSWVSSTIPPAALASTAIKQIAFGPDWAVALRADGTLEAWGGGTVVRDPAVTGAVRSRSTFEAIGGRGALFCMIDKSGLPTCVAHHANKTPPAAVGKTIWIDASSPRGAVPACILSENAGQRMLSCTESNKGRSLGPLQGDILDAAVGDDHVCALYRGNRVQCFGDDMYGRVTSRSLMTDASWP